MTPGAAPTASAPRALVRHLPLAQPAPETAGPAARGEGAWRWLEAAFLSADQVLERLVPPRHNPLTQTGAIANTCFLVASISGVVLLYWYRTSVHEAHASVLAMGAARWGAGWVRSLHRYSSDACLLFVLLHALRLLGGRRFGGARWVAWVTGAFLVSALWLVGWLGYWLVWDQRAQQVARGSARLLDPLPLFTDLFSRSFLTDVRVNSLLFFVVFFLHMLLPLAMGVALWLHVTRLSRSRFLTDRTMTAWVLGTLTVMSWAIPADTAPAAQLGLVPGGMTMDAWYLLPLFLTDRLGGGALWGVALVSGVLLYSVPWMLARPPRAPASVVPARCNECRTCATDCPYDAISMVPRAERGSRWATVAQVDPSKCVGCSVCAGSCDSAGVGVPWFDTVVARHEVDRRVEAAVAGGEHPRVAFVCAESGGGRLSVGADGSVPSLPGVRVVRVPCTGWLHPLTVERALRHGARDVVVVTCPVNSCAQREGARWTLDRLLGQRRPSLRRERLPDGAVTVVEVPRTDLAGSFTALRADPIRTRAPSTGTGGPTGDDAPRRGARGRDGSGGASAAGSLGAHAVGGVAAATLLAVVTVAATAVPYSAPRPELPELVVTFLHAGSSADRCRDRTEAELAALPRHMRQRRLCERRRPAVGLRVLVDDTVVLERQVPPRGLWGDGSSVALERIPLPAGQHRVRVELADGGGNAGATHSAERVVELRPGWATVVAYERGTGFTWTAPP